LVCPKCGSTRFDIVYFDLIEQAYDAATDEWGWSETLGGESYVEEVRCADCDTLLPPEEVKRFFIPTESLLAERLQVAVVYIAPGEGGVALKPLGGQWKMVYIKPNDAGPYAMAPKAVAEAICQVLGSRSFEPPVHQTFAFEGANWDEIPSLLGEEVSDDGL